MKIIVKCEKCKKKRLWFSVGKQCIKAPVPGGSAFSHDKICKPCAKDVEKAVNKNHEPK